MSTDAGRAKLGSSTAVVNSLSGDTWITLNTTENIGGKLTDLSVYTYDPEDNYAGKETTVYLDDKALWGGENHDQPVYVYYWGVKTMSWPGKEMKYDENIKMYYATIPSGSPFLVFNNGAAIDGPECKRPVSRRCRRTARRSASIMRRVSGNLISIRKTRSLRQSATEPPRSTARRYKKYRK